MLVLFDIDQGARSWVSLRAVNTTLHSLLETIQCSTRITTKCILSFANEDKWLDEEYFGRVFELTGLFVYFLQRPCPESGLTDMAYISPSAR